MGRAPCCDKANVKKGPWSPEEDATLKAYIEKHGTGGNWIALPQKIGLKRCGKSCRLRWLNYLRPNIKHGGFTEEEENIICNLYINIGSRWSIIAAQLPGRTDNDIKNYWNTRLKKKLMAKQRKEQAEMKKESESFLVSQALNQNQIPYWVDQQALGGVPMMHHPHPNQDHAQLLIGSHQDNLTRLLTKIGGQYYHEHGPGPQLVSNGITNYPYALQLQDQELPSAHVLAASTDSRSMASYFHWPNAEYDAYQGQGNFPAELEVYLNNLLSFEGTENYSSSGTDLVGNSSTTSTSAGSSSLGDMSSLVNTPGSDFDAYQNGTLQKVAQ